MPRALAARGIAGLGARAPVGARACGLPEPIMMKRAGCWMLTPSRSTVLTPEAAESSTTSTRPSSSRLTSSTYRMPRLALACARRPQP